VTQNRRYIDLELWKKQGFVNILLTHAGLVDLLNLRSRGKQMYGVIIWIEEKSGNALIWCDDHGQLAYFVAAECTLGPTDFSVGDLVKFVEGYKGRVRRAYDVVVANPAQYTTLKNDMLHHARSKSDQTHVSPKFAKTADRNIVPFSSRSQSMQK